MVYYLSFLVRRAAERVARRRSVLLRTTAEPECDEGRADWQGRQNVGFDQAGVLFTS